jgi:rhodanese-related sulfurtransferase
MSSVNLVDARTAKDWLDKSEAVIVDVREPGEYSAKHIRGAVLIPIATITSESLANFKNKKIIVHCQFGRRGSMACEKLLQGSLQLEVYNLEGGMTAWENAGYEVVRSGKFFLSLDRQVQLTIGSGVLLGVILGYFFHPAFLLLSGFFGLGLLYAGISGSCGLALLLAKMPWNRS